MSKVADNWHPKWYEMLYEQEGLSKMKHKWKVREIGNEYRIVILVDGSQVFTIARCGGGTEDLVRADRICEYVNGWDELQAELELYRESRNYPEIIKLKKQRDALLKALKARVVKCCGTCDSFQENTVYEFNYDGKCPFDSKGYRKTASCDKWNIEAISLCEK